MKKLLLVSLCFLLSSMQIFAQGRTVTGKVTDKDDGGAIPGVSVVVKGTKIGVVTKADGTYTITVPATGKELQFSFIGYTTLTKPITGGVVNAVLSSSSNQLGEVVVTGALGIKKQAKELGYASTTITSKDLTATSVTNFANGLTGKVAGLAIYSLDDGIDPKLSVVLRGNRSLTGDNNALIVLDGVPLPDGLLSSINPNDIDEVTILRGAGSAALYGSEASNGAILITTKKGITNDKPVITYDNSIQLSPVAYYPKLQSTYGPYGGESVASGYVNPITGESYYVPYENQLYGPAYGSSAAQIGPAYYQNGLVQVGAAAGSATGPVNYQPYTAQSVSPIHAFFNTGILEQNSLSFEQGNPGNAFAFSFWDTHQLGSTPGDTNDKLAFSLRGIKSSGIFSLEYNAGYTRTSISTYGNAYKGGLFAFQSIYATLMQFPAFLDVNSFKDVNGTFSNPSDYYNAYAINPWWIIEDSRTNTQRDVFFSDIALKLSPTKWFDASYRVSDNFGISQVHQYSQEVDFSAYGISDPYGAGNVPSNFKVTGKAPGTVFDAYEYGDGTESENLNGYSRIQADALLSFHHTFFDDYKASLSLGNTVWQEYTKGQFTGSSTLLVNNFYNINTITGIPTALEGEGKIRQIAFYGDLNLSYKGWLNFEGTLRNDHDSRLSASERSFFYPSGKISFIPTDIIPGLKNNDILDYAKLRASLSQVGNVNVNPYQIINNYTLTNGFPYGGLGGLTQGTENYSPTLKPEITNELEFGTELSFFKSRLDIDATYYDQHVKNQTVPVGTSIATGYSQYLLNVGETESWGEEFQITGDLLTKQKNKVLVELGSNLSINDSKVLSLQSGASSFQLSNNVGVAGVAPPQEYAVVGQPFPLLEGTDFVRDPANGKVVVDPVTGYPSTSQTLRAYGRTTPKYDLGITFKVGYKFIELSAVAEYRGGYVVYNGVGQTLNFSGASAVSAEAGRQAFVYPNSEVLVNGVYVANTNINVQNGNYGFWQSSAYNTTNYPLVSSGAFWKLREVKLDFNLDQLIKKTHFIKKASFALTGRNLLMLTPKSNPWTDPEFSDASSTSNLRGLNSDAQTPGTRIFGADLKLTF